MGQCAIQVGPETADQHQVGGGKWFRGKVFERLDPPHWTLSPQLANHTHILPPAPRPRNPLHWHLPGPRPVDPQSAPKHVPSWSGQPDGSTATAVLCRG